MLRPLLIVVALVTSLSACDKFPGKGDKKDAATAPPKLVIAPEDFITIKASALASGPVVTGSIQPERKADLRAEVSAVVLQVLKENGDAVRRGDVLVRLDQTSIRDNLNSAEDNVRNATQSLDQAERNLQRLKTLRASGMTSLQALDDAEVRRNGAIS
ncbi:MAG: biotin/lipoyl-binding protein, partial [Burkholderiaceae bacterium]|nr:biotin/lipoyl-binding protein [Burkholderiaceae bacterium]